MMSPHLPHLKRIQQCYPELAINAVQIDTDGSSSDVLILNGERVFRFPNNEQARQSLWREAAITRVVYQHVSLPVPMFDRLEDDFGSYRLIPGQHLVRNVLLALPAELQTGLLTQLGEFISQIHNIPSAQLDGAGIGYSSAYRRPEQWLEFYRQVERDLFPIMLTHSREWVESHFAPLLADPAWMEAPLTFVNGNLGPYHILYDPPSLRLTGILDFGASGLGDPAQDVAVLLYYYGERLVRQVGQVYPALAGMIERARFLAGTVELQWALDGVHRGNCFGTLGYISSARDILPVGSGW